MEFRKKEQTKAMFCEAGFQQGRNIYKIRLIVEYPSAAAVGSIRCTCECRVALRLQTMGILEASLLQNIGHAFEQIGEFFMIIWKVERLGGSIRKKPPPPF